MEFEAIHIVYLAITGKLTASTFFCPNFTSNKEFFCISVLSVFFFYENAFQVTHRRAFCAFNIVSSQTALCKSYG